VEPKAIGIVAHGWLCGAYDCDIPKLTTHLEDRLGMPWVTLFTEAMAKSIRVALGLDPLPDKNRKAGRVPTTQTIEAAKRAASVLTPNERQEIALWCSKLVRE
jgi:hypothetical protein